MGTLVATLYLVLCVVNANSSVWQEM